MKLSLLLSISLLVAWQAARAQTAADFFNSGAHFYISNSIPEALVPVEQGMKQYPDDVKLKKLYELLKQQQQQQQQQNQQNQSQQQQSKSQQNQKQQQKQQQSQQNSQQQKQDEQKQSEQQKQEQQQQPQKKSAEKQEKEQGQPVAAGQMTPEEAKRLLDAQKGDEQFLQMKPQGKPENLNQSIKDW